MISQINLNHAIVDQAPTMQVFAMTESCSDRGGEWMELGEVSRTVEGVGGYRGLVGLGGLVVPWDKGWWVC